MSCSGSAWFPGLLRESEHRGDITLDRVIAIAKDALGEGAEL